MYFPITLFNVVTLFLMAVTAFIAVKRFTFRVDSNWPLVYYVVLIAYWRGFPYTLENYWVLGGVLCALLLRFEFLGGAAVKLIRAVELAVFAYVMLRCVKLILMW